MAPKLTRSPQVRSPAAAKSAKIVRSNWEVRLCVLALYCAPSAPWAWMVCFLNALALLPAPISLVIFSPRSDLRTTSFLFPVLLIGSVSLSMIVGLLYWRTDFRQVGKQTSGLILRKIPGKKSLQPQNAVQLRSVVNLAVFVRNCLKIAILLQNVCSSRSILTNVASALQGF